MTALHFKVLTAMKFGFSGKETKIGHVIVTGKPVGQNGAIVFTGRSRLDFPAIVAEYGTLAPQVEKRAIKVAQEACAQYVQTAGKYAFTHHTEDCLETEVKEVK